MMEEFAAKNLHKYRKSETRIVPGLPADQIIQLAKREKVDLVPTLEQVLVLSEHEFRKRSIRRQVFGVPARPRLTVFRSAKHIYAQVIDDDRGVTLAAASSLDKGLRVDLNTGADKAAAAAVGKLVGERAKAAGVGRVVFDRGAYPFHGRVKALADAAREAGLEF